MFFSKILSFLLVISIPIISNAYSFEIDKSASYNEARQAFETQLTKDEYKPDGEAPNPPSHLLKKITYPSVDGELVAYLSPDPQDQKKHPVLIWARGGHGGIGEWLWDKDYVLANAIQKGLIVMAPSWRQDNANPGRYSLFFGEVDDALAAIDYVKSLDYVDTNRIYMAGHSTGGTMSLLTPLASKDIRASFSFGGVPDMTLHTEDGQYGREPYDYKKKDESYIRSATNYVKDIHCPTFYFEGTEMPSYVSMAESMENKAKEHGVPFFSYPIEGSGHSEHLVSLMNLVTDKILADTGEQVSISFTQEEVQTTYDKSQAFPVLKISVLASNEVFLGDTAVGPTDLQEVLAWAANNRGVVWYYRENPNDEPPPAAAHVIQMIVDHQLPVSMSTKPDFSDYVDENGNSVPRQQ